MNSDWHLSKTVTVGNMLTIFAAVIALAGSYYTLDKRIAIVESGQLDLAVHMENEKVERKKDVERVCDRLERIEDLLIDYVMKESKR